MCSHDAHLIFGTMVRKKKCAGVVVPSTFIGLDLPGFPAGIDEDGWEILVNIARGK